MKKTYFSALLIIVVLIFPNLPVHAQDTTPVVHAVLFYSPTCGHCEFVITQTILPMMDEYGEQLQVIGIDVTKQEGQTLFHSAMNMFNLEQAGVPFLVIDDMYLIGSADIPEQFPPLVDSYLAEGGVDFPKIPGLAEILNQTPAEEAPTAESPASVAPEPASPIPTPGIELVESHNTMHWTERFAQDPAGNGLSVIVLAGMLVSLAWVASLFRRRNVTSSNPAPVWLVPLLCAIGVGVAGYLTYVETTHTAAVCGPVGDCNTVQQSAYARLFGIFPIGILGLVGYLVVFASWFVARYGKKPLTDLAALAVFLLTLLGTLFSIYLTFLEPFIIGATCIWCLSSAILMTVLFLLAATPAKIAFSHVWQQKRRVK